MSGHVASKMDTCHCVAQPRTTCSRRIAMPYSLQRTHMTIKAYLSAVSDNLPSLGVGALAPLVKASPTDVAMCLNSCSCTPGRRLPNRMAAVCKRSLA